MSTTFTRKQFLTVAGAGLGTLALGACAGPSTDGGGPDTKAVAVDWSTIKPASSISYMSSHPGKSRNTELLLIESFQEENPGITVNLVTGGANYEEVAQKFQTSQAGNDVPDVLLASDVWWFRYALSGAILPLNELLKATNTDISGYVPGLVSDYEYDQKQWAIPYARSTPLA